MVKTSEKIFNKIDFQFLNNNAKKTFNYILRRFATTEIIPNNVLNQIMCLKEIRRNCFGET